jgi:5-methyltetrahydrofolate--homocysteine methyltransferase
MTDTTTPSLEFKDDFAEAADRWQAFWVGRNTLPVVGAVVPRSGVTPIEKPVYAAGAEGDLEPVIEQLLAWAETHQFVRDAIPFYYLEFAADHFATFLGADLEWREGQEGGWAVPCIDDLASAEIHFDRDGKWWRRTVEFAQALRGRCDGKLLIASNTLSSNLDALAALYGSNKLLMALVDQPDNVHRALEQIDRAHAEVLDALADLLDYPRWGSINRHGMYTRGRINVPQCDVSCMISREMFNEFALPYLRREMERLNAVEYHLDGPGAIQHLESLCGLDDLDVVQWVPGAGNEDRDWSDLYRRIDELGKGQILGGRPDSAARRWEEFRIRKLFFRLRVDSSTEVDEFVEQLGAAIDQRQGAPTATGNRTRRPGPNSIRPASGEVGSSEAGTLQ